MDPLPFGFVSGKAKYSRERGYYWEYPVHAQFERGAHPDDVMEEIDKENAFADYMQDREDIVNEHQGFLYNALGYIEQGPGLIWKKVKGHMSRAGYASGFAADAVRDYEQSDPNWSDRLNQKVNDWYYGKKENKNLLEPEYKVGHGNPSDQLTISPIVNKTNRKRRRAPRRRRNTRNSGYMRMNSGRMTERKYVDSASYVDFKFNTTGTIQNAAVIPVGSGQGQRVGRQAILRSIRVHGIAFSNTATNITSGRVLLIQDKQPNKALAAITDVLTTNFSLSMPNYENKKRFKTLLSHQCTLSGPSGATAYGNSGCSLSFFKKLYIPIEYSTVGDGEIGDIVRNALLLMTTGTDAAGTADATWRAKYRVTYTDA